MRVLNERKPSLLLKRGLVVLSIFALAFAFMGCGGSTTYVEVPTPGPPVEVPVQGPYVTRITLLNVADVGARNIQWQGLPVNLEGAVLDVEWSDGARRNVVVGEGEFGNPALWSTIPEAVDGTATGTDGESFQVVHRFSANARSAGFHLTNIVPLYSFSAVAPADFTWFSDQRPDFIEGISLHGVWEHPVVATFTDDNRAFGPLGRVFGTRPGEVIASTDSGYVNGALATAGWLTTATRSDFIPITRGYPALNFNYVLNVPRRVYVEIYDQVASITIGRFLEPIEITLIPPTGAAANNFFLRDDQFKGMAVEEIEDVLLDILRDVNPRFTVRYDATTTREISWVEFVANRQWHKALIGEDAADIEINYRHELVAALGRILPAGQDDGWEDEVLIADPGDFWNWGVDYVGRMADLTHRVVAQIPTPLYTFVSFAPNFLRPIGLRENPTITQTDDDPSEASDLDGLLVVLEERWDLWGVYQRGTATRELRMDFNFDMFQYTTRAGRQDNHWPWWNLPTLAGGVANPNHDPAQIWFPAWPTDHWGPATPFTHTVMYANWPLEINWRRGARINRAESVQVNVLSYHNAPNYITSLNIRLPLLTMAPYAMDPASWTDMNNRIESGVTAAQMWNGFTLAGVTGVSTPSDGGNHFEVILNFVASDTDWAFSSNLSAGSAVTVRHSTNLAQNLERFGVGVAGRVQDWQGGLSTFPAANRQIVGQGAPGTYDVSTYLTVGRGGNALSVRLFGSWTDFVTAVP